MARVADVLIAIPNGGWVRAELLSDLMPYFAHGARLIAPIGHKPGARARNHCVEDFLASKFEYLWFVDHDVLPPRGALPQLLKQEALAITGVYHTLKWMDNGQVGSVPLVARRDEDGAMKAVFGDKGVERVDRCGAGCWLLHRDAFIKVGEPWFEERSWGPNRTGQDFVFCEKLEAAGIPLFADLSVRALHKKEVDL